VGEPERVSQVRVAFQEGDARSFGRVRAGVPEDVQAVADVDDADQSLAERPALRTFGDRNERF